MAKILAPFRRPVEPEKKTERPLLSPEDIFENALLSLFAPPAMRPLIVAPILLLCIVRPTAVSGEAPNPASPDSTLQGVVWTPSPSADSASHTLQRIHRMGATAVRIPHFSTNDSLLAAADSLEVTVFADLPLSYTSAEALDDSLVAASSALNRLFTLAERHPSLQYVGLGHSADTTVPHACEILSKWTDYVHAESGLSTYYVTPFTATADQCAEAVDQPLLDLRGHPAPVKRWQEWPSQTASAGLGAVGTWVHSDAASGFRVPHSAQHQARYLERTLSRFLDSTQAPPPVLFVSRWQDREPPLLPSRRYGLHDTAGAPRPAARVVRGMYTGTQRTFAFSSGSAPASAPSGLTLLGWGLVALLGGLYAGNVFVHQTAARYFTAHGFYQDALRDGHMLHPGANGLLLGIVGGILVTVGSRIARLAATEPGSSLLIAAVPPNVRSVMVTGLEHPLTAGLAVGVGGLGLLLVWMTALVLTARRWTPFSFAQGLVLVTWPCWPILFALPLALAAGPEAPLSPALLVRLFLGGGGLVLLSVTVRVLYDYWTVTDLPGWSLLPLSALSPFVLTATALLALAFWYDVPFSFLWRLATQT